MASGTTIKKTDMVTSQIKMASNETANGNKVTESGGWETSTHLEWID